MARYRNGAVTTKSACRHSFAARHLSSFDEEARDEEARDIVYESHATGTFKV